MNNCNRKGEKSRTIDDNNDDDDYLSTYILMDPI